MRVENASVDFRGWLLLKNSNSQKRKNNIFEAAMTPRVLDDRLDHPKLLGAQNRFVVEVCAEFFERYWCCVAIAGQSGDLP